MKYASMVLGLSLVALGGCTTPADSSQAQDGSAAAPMAKAMLMAADGSARGEATVTQASDGLHVTVKATGLEPGVHAAHIHTTGVCTAPDFTSAGGHWNPMGKQHGMENPAGMHMGDMPNMTVGPDGSGAMDYVIKGGMLTGGDHPLLDADGAAVVIHAGPDDNKSDPAGNAGSRKACGVLVAA